MSRLYQLDPSSSSSTETETEKEGATASFDDLDLHRYPSPTHYDVKRRLCELRAVPSVDHVFLGVGSDEVIDLLFRITCIPAKDRVLVCPPTYGMYGVCAQINDVDVVKVNLDVKGGAFRPRVDEVSFSPRQKRHLANRRDKQVVDSPSPDADQPYSVGSRVEPESDQARVPVLAREPDRDLDLARRRPRRPVEPGLPRSRRRRRGVHRLCRPGQECRPVAGRGRVEQPRRDADAQ